MRSGSWNHTPAIGRSANRYPQLPDKRYGDHGFRLAADVSEVEPPVPPKAEADFVPLFNGKDLTGWSIDPSGRVGYWKVVDGAITCTGALSHLFTTKDGFEDFHLRVEAKVSDGGNGGVYFRIHNRTRGRSSIPDGFEAAIECNSHPQRTGSLFDFAKNSENLIRADTWFTMEVIAKSNNIQILVEGKQVVDYIDTKRTWARGWIALQHHDEKTRISFRKIEIKTGK